MSLPTQKNKYGGRHTTFIETASTICDFLEKMNEVTKISPGIIITGIKSGRGKRVKVKSSPGSLLLAIRHNAALQMVRVYTTNNSETITSLRTQAARKNIEVTEQ